MRMTTLMAGATLALGMMAAAAPSQASPAHPHFGDTSKMIVQARDDHDRDHDHDRRRSPRFRLYLNDGGGNSCRYVRHECAEEYDWGSWRFRGCVRRQGC